MREHGLTFQGPQMVLVSSGVRKGEQCSEGALSRSYLLISMAENADMGNGLECRKSSKCNEEQILELR